MSGARPSEVQVDLSSCDREPIHVPGSIQAHGVLLAVSEPDLTVTHASANAEIVLGASQRCLGRGLAAVVGGEPLAAIRRGMTDCDLGQHPCRIGGFAAPSGRLYDVLAHRHGGALFLEFEPAAERDPTHDRLQDYVAAESDRLDRATTLEGLCVAAAAAVRRLSGFDKVMVYRFDQDWNGTVLAEEGPADMEAYLGLRFPASDIPAQARELYRLNPVRLIPDVGYAPVPVDAAAQAAPPLDLSYAVLRSVSPVHVEYLKNMAVAASMSVSVLRGGRLLGLIACHHRRPRFVPHAVRSACAVLARLLAQLLGASEAWQEAAYGERVNAARARLVKHVGSREHLADALVERAEELLQVVDAEGAALCVDGECRLVGATPPAECISRLAEWLAAAEGPVFHTDWLAGSFPEAAEFRGRASGLLAVTLSSVYRNYLMWFRPEQVQTVRWAGDPSKPVSPSTATDRLHPRRSFQAWAEQVGQRSRPWRPAEVAAAAALREALVDAVLRKAEEAAARAKDHFLAVLSHELRTPLSPVLTAASALEQDPSLSADAREMMRIIRRNVELETRLIDDLLDLTRISKGKLVLNPETLDLHSVISAALEVCDADLHEKGIDVAVAADAAAHHVEGDRIRLQQVLWNLLKNAIKFTPPGGRIDVRTSNENGARVRVEVADTGAGIDPAVLPGIFNAFEQGGRTVTSRYGGLGLGLAIAKTLVEIHRGRISASSRGKGHGATFVVELPTVPPAPTPDAGAAPAGGAAGATPGGAKVRILLVEDHKDTARVMARLLEQLQYEIRTADSLAAARKLVAGYSFDLVISDLGLPDGSGNDLMRELRGTRGMRGIALTGWGMEEDVAQSRDAGFDRHLTKPVDFASLQAAIRAIVAVDRSGG